MTHDNVTILFRIIIICIYICGSNSLSNVMRRPTLIRAWNQGTRISSYLSSVVGHCGLSLFIIRGTDLPETGKFMAESVMVCSNSHRAPMGNNNTCVRWPRRTKRWGCHSIKGPSLGVRSAVRFNIKLPCHGQRLTLGLQLDTSPV